MKLNIYEETIKSNLEYHNMKIKDLAKLTDTSKKHLSEIISGKAKPSYELTIRIEKIFGIPENTLFLTDLRTREQQKLEKDKDILNIYEKVKNTKKYERTYKGSVLKMIADELKGSLNLFKGYLSENSVDFFKYKDEPVAYYWIATMDNKYGHLNSKGTFKKSVGNTVIKNTLDILYDKGSIDIRIKRVIEYLDSKGIVLRNSQFLSGSNINGAVLKKDKQFFIFMNDKQKREYQYIFALVHELMHIYMDHDDDNDKVAKLIRTYEAKYNKKHKELDLAMKIFESDELPQVKWDLLHEQTKKKVEFEPAK